MGKPTTNQHPIRETHRHPRVIRIQAAIYFIIRRLQYPAASAPLLQSQPQYEINLNIYLFSLHFNGTHQQTQQLYVLPHQIT